MIQDAEIHKVYIYPNPLKGEVYIDLCNLSSMMSYEILNRQGQIIQENKNLIIRNTISLKTLPSGLYTVKVKSKNTVMIKKFLKL